MGKLLPIIMIGHWELRARRDRFYRMVEAISSKNWEKPKGVTSYVTVAYLGKKKLRSNLAPYLEEILITKAQGVPIQNSS